MSALALPGQVPVQGQSVPAQRAHLPRLHLRASRGRDAAADSLYEGVVPHIPSTRDNSDGDPELLHLGQAGSTHATDPRQRRAAPSTEAPAEHSPAKAAATLTGSGLWPQALHPFSQHHLLAWRQCTTDAWVLATVHSGFSSFKPDFLSSKGS
ncbi:UNVERIFIED_CONTAM: hypothetical protein FKN15_054056 [Acipenser sinensis]